jgi:hypothetical protein
LVARIFHSRPPLGKVEIVFDNLNGATARGVIETAPSDAAAETE